MAAARRPDPKDIVTRMPRSLTVRVKTIAEREGETDATIFRRALRAGLALEERRHDPSDEAGQCRPTSRRGAHEHGSHR